MTTALALLLLAGCGGGADAPSSGGGGPALGRLAQGETTGFPRVTAVRPLAFPEDHGAHPEYRHEWWYFSGNLRDLAGQRYGFQLTFVRFALRPYILLRGSHWGAQQVYLAHFALSDVGAGRFHAWERYARDAQRLAGAQTRPLRVWLEDWSLAADRQEPTLWRLRAAEGDSGIDLRLRAEKPVVLHGNEGLSQKSAEHGNATYYYSLTRMRAEGTIRSGGASREVRGGAWFDREWGTAGLAPYQTGWDWFALQFSDGQDLMYFQLRERDGAQSPFSSGSLVAADGHVLALRREDVSLEVLDWWRAPQGVRYPARWRLSVWPLRRRWEVRPVLADQELRVSLRYWEGAVDVLDEEGRTSGVGYLEMTGYAGGP